MAKIIKAEFRDGEDSDVERLLAQAMRVSRLRAGLRPEEFARALRRRCPRDPGLTGDSIRAYEDGRSRPRADIYILAISLADPGMLGRLQEWIVRAAVPVGLLLLAHHFLRVTAGISPWW